ncbi:MAG: YdeI/OmpD-associated family protein [Actinomycetota bacterium]
MEITGKPLHFTTADEWRAWLQANHATEKDVWLTFYKKHSATPSITFEEATDEALSFGWIDSSMKRIDDEKYVLRYTPRRKGSNWSERNKKRVAELIEQGGMTEAGLAKIDEAKQSGKWDDANRKRA